MLAPESSVFVARSLLTAVSEDRPLVLSFVQVMSMSSPQVRVC